jgi:hypothetical protein
MEKLRLIRILMEVKFDILEQKCILEYKSGDYFGELALLKH